MGCKFVIVPVVWKDVVEKGAAPATDNRPMFIQPSRRDLNISPVSNVGYRHRGLFNLLRIFYWSRSNSRRDVARDAQKEQADT